MFLPLFANLRAAKVPVTLREFLTLLEAVRADLVTYDIDGFYYLARAALVKDERHLDRFDQVFSHTFKGLEHASLADVIERVDIPDDWLKKLAEKQLSEEEKAKIQSLGGFEKLMETLKERLKEQQKRHQGGSKWIGTAGTSPFGAYGYNPEGVRIGQDESRHQRAVKVWDKRDFRNLDDSIELGTRNIKVALKRLRQWARDGADAELDLNGTIRATAEHGYLDVITRPERRNAVKVLLFLDVERVDGTHISRWSRNCFPRQEPSSKHLEILLLSQLPLRRRLERQSPQVVRSDTDLGRAENLWPGLQMRLCRRRVHVTLRGSLIQAERTSTGTRKPGKPGLCERGINGRPIFG